ERRKERIALGGIDETPLRRDRLADQIVMGGQDLRPRRTQPRRQPRRTLDIREQERDRALGRTRRILHTRRLTRHHRPAATPEQCPATAATSNVDRERWRYCKLGGHWVVKV